MACSLQRLRGPAKPNIIGIAGTNTASPAVTVTTTATTTGYIFAASPHETAIFCAATEIAVTVTAAVAVAVAVAVVRVLAVAVAVGRKRFSRAPHLLPLGVAMVSLRHHCRQHTHGHGCSCGCHGLVLRLIADGALAFQRVAA
jgi:hypothetical protein